MKEYEIWFEAGASTRVTVEAEDLESAIELAYEELPYVCAMCAGMGYSRGKSTGIDLGDWEVNDKAAQEDYPNE